MADQTADYALIAIQGPRAAGILDPLAERPAGRGASTTPATRHAWPAGVLLARTGYTGEDGFEIFASPADAGHLDRAGRGGSRPGLVPAGLAARDTLRLEAGMPLYGNELGPDLTPYDAGLGRVVKLGQAGRLRRPRRRWPRGPQAAPERVLVGLAGHAAGGQARLPGALGRAAARRGDQRLPVADAGPADRHGLRHPAGGGDAAERRGGPAGRGHPGRRRARHTTAAAVLPESRWTNPPVACARPTPDLQRATPSVPEELHYTPEHEWVAISGTTASVGITDHAQRALGDVVYVSLPSRRAPGSPRASRAARWSRPSRSATCTPPSTARSSR